MTLVFFFDCCITIIKEKGIDMHNERQLSMLRFCSLLASVFFMFFVFAAAVSAEMYIHLNSGEVVKLPYNRADIEKVTYSGDAKVRAGLVTLVSHNYPNHAIRHRNFLAEISELHSQLDKQDATFKVVRGLSDPSAISFESVNYPGYYLRHQNFQIKLHKNDGSGLFLADATFRKVSGLTDGSKYSFESINYPNHYIRHKNFRLYIEQGSGNLYSNDCTFSMGPPAWRQ